MHTEVLNMHIHSVILSGGETPHRGAAAFSPGAGREGDRFVFSQRRRIPVGVILGEREADPPPAGREPL